MIREPQLLTIVVGASRGLGRHLAIRAAGNGSAVLACARSQAELHSLATECRGQPVAVDVELAVGDFLGARADLEPLAERVARHEGPVSVVITAATIGPVGALTRIDLGDWADALDRNVAGPARLLARLLPELGPRDLVVLFSGGGVGGPNPQPHVSSYTTAKAALMALTEIVAREQPGGPTIVSIAPGSFPTGFTDPVLAADPAVAGSSLLEDVARARAGTFDPSALDALLDYLETEDVSWLSGRTISARRDRPTVLAELDAVQRSSADLFRLRRVDGAGVIVQAW